MKKFYSTLLLLSVFSAFSFGQSITASISSPANNAHFCNQSSITFTVGTPTQSGCTGAGNLAYAFYIDGNAAPLQTGASNTYTINTCTFSDSGSYYVVVTRNACSVTTASVRIEIDSNSVGGAVSGGTTPICQGTATGNMALGGHTGSVVKWQKRVNAGAWTDVAVVSTTFSEVPSSAGTWEYRVEVKNGVCASAFSTPRSIVVEPTSVGGSITGGTTPLCLGTATGTMTLGGNTGTIVKWQKRLNAGAWTDIVNTIATYAETPSSAGTWDYRAEVKSGTCASVFSSNRSIVVDPTSVGGSIAGGSTPICQGTATGTMTLSGHTGTVVKWQRRLNAGAWTDITNTTTTHSETPASAGSWEYRAEVKSGSCASTFSGSRSILVDATSVGGTASANQNVCNGDGPNNPLTVSGITGSVVKWQYATNLAFTTGVTDIPSSASATLTTGQIGNLNVTRYYRAVVQNGACPTSNSTIVTLSVTPSVGTPTAITVSSGTEPTCELTNGTTTTTYSTTASNSTSFNWSLSTPAAGTINNSGVLTWANGFSGNVTIRVTADGCNGPSTQTTRVVTVHPNPNAAFTINDNRQCLRGNRFIFKSTSNISSGSIANWAWTFGSPNAGSANSSSVDSIIRNFTTASTSQSVKLVVTSNNGCKDSVFQSVVIDSTPSSRFTISPANICQGSPVSFTNIGNGVAATLNWYFGNGDSLVNQTTNTASNVYSNFSQPTFNVRLVTTSSQGCTDDSTKAITVNPNPVVNFTVNDTSQCLGTNSFVYTNQSTVPGSTIPNNGYVWSFGGGGNSTLASPTHTYTATGTYTVTNTVTSNNGCIGSKTIQVSVYNNPTALISLSPNRDTICSGTDITLSTNSGFNYTWSTTATTQSITVTGTTNQSPTTTSYRVTITDNNSCSSTATRNITVVPAPTKPQIAYNTAAIFCRGAKAQNFSVANRENARYRWSSNPFAVVYGIDSANANFDLPNSAGVFRVIVTATAGTWGCTRADTALINISNNQAPTGGVIKNQTNLICTNNTANTYQWGYDNLGLQETPLAGETQQNYEAGTNPDVSVSGKYYWVIITDAGGCQSKIYYQTPTAFFTDVSNVESDKLHIKVYPNPTADNFNVDISSMNQSDFGSINVYDFEGRIIFSDTASAHNSINTNNWPKGIYLIRVVSENGISHTQKIIKH
jgi:PKD repeat protein